MVGHRQRQQRHMELVRRYALKVRWLITVSVAVLLLSGVFLLSVPVASGAAGVVVTRAWPSNS